MNQIGKMIYCEAIIIKQYGAAIAMGELIV